LIWAWVDSQDLKLQHAKNRKFKKSKVKKSKNQIFKNQKAPSRKAFFMVVVEETVLLRVETEREHFFCSFFENRVTFIAN
jgi:hypothetical protein